jgi:hypothetical protein
LKQLRSSSKTKWHSYDQLMDKEKSSLCIQRTPGMGTAMFEIQCFKNQNSVLVQVRNELWFY